MRLHPVTGSVGMAVSLGVHVSFLRRRAIAPLLPYDPLTTGEQTVVRWSHVRIGIPTCHDCSTRVSDIRPQALQNALRASPAYHTQDGEQ